MSLTRTLRLQREVFRFAQGNSSALGKKKETSFFCFALVFSSLDAQRRLSLTRTLPLRGELTWHSAKKRNSFFCFALVFS